MNMKLCERCQKKPAVVFVVQKIGDERKTRDYCIQCAKELDIPQVKEYMRDNGLSLEEFERMSEQMLQMNEAKAEKPAVPEQKPKRCSFCGKRDAVCVSENGAYQLCTECCFLLYPQMDVQTAAAQGIPIEKALNGRKPPNPCAICGIREAQFFRADGNYCIACAQRQDLPEAQKMARRMGISEFDLEVFAIAAAGAKPEQKTASAASASDAAPAAGVQPQRFEVADRSTVDGKELLVLRDNFTGIHYLTNGQFSAFTPLLDGSGKPFVFIG